MLSNPVTDMSCGTRIPRWRNPVFVAEPGLGCTFERRERVRPAPAASPAVITFPVGCTCAYSGWSWSGDPSKARMTRDLNWACSADHAEIDQIAGVCADSPLAVRPEGI